MTTLWLILALILGLLAYGAWRISRGPGGLKRLGVALALAVGLPYAAWHIAFPSVTHRYRLTLTADDNGRTVNGFGRDRGQLLDTTADSDNG